jgi:hypothetical protein
VTDKTTWDSFVKNNHTSTLMHNWDFLKIIEKYSNHKLLPYGIYKNDDLVCIIPLFLKQYFLIKLLFSPPPNMGLPYLGFVFNDDFFSLRADQKESFLKSMFIDINEEIKNINPSYLLITSTPYLTDFRFFKWNKYALDIKHTYTMDLSKSKKQILKEMKNKKRQKINKAKREKIEIYEVNDPGYLYDSLKEKYIEQNMNPPIKSKEYLCDLKKLFPHNIVFRIAKKGEEIVGSEGLINFNGYHLNWIGGSTPDKGLPVNELFIWDYIEKAKEKGLNKFDFVGANNEHISFFKSQFGPDLTPYYTITKTNLLGKMMEKIYLSFIKKSVF